MSPEQATGEREIDGRSDIYSLGVVAYQMLTGRVPFTGSNQMALLLKHVTERPRPIGDLRPDSPRGLAEVIERAMMKDPEDRWPSAAALRDGLMAGDTITPTWRAEHHEPVRFVSPPRGTRRDRGREVKAAEPAASSSMTVDPPSQLPVQVPMAGNIILEQPHLTTLTEEQRKDLRLWHGRVHLADRIKAERWYLLLTLGAIAGGITGFVVGIEEGVPPLVVAPVVSFYMSWKFWMRGKSLRASGLKLRRVLFMPRAKWVLPRAPKVPNEAQLEKIAPREVLDGPHGAAIRRAVDDRAAILDIVSHLPRADRAVFPDLPQLVKALVDRVADLAKMHYSLNREVDWRLVDELDRRIADMSRQTASLDAQRQLGLLQRQRATLEELVQRLDALSRQVDSAGLALGNLRYDLIKFRSSGEESALSDVSSATQEVRALQREIDLMLESAAEVRDL
jgi:serine/threonine-protein kinase